MPKISLDEAKTMISLYKDQKAVILAEGVDENILSTSETFDLSDINAIISQPDCKSVRIYYGMSKDLNVHAILVGVDGNENEMVSQNDPVIIEEGRRCPPMCPPQTSLGE